MARTDQLLVGPALYARPQGLELALHVLITAVNLVDVADGRGAFGSKRRQEQGHARTDIGALKLLAEELGAPLNETPIRIAQDDARPHTHKLVGEVHAARIHPVVKQDGTGGLRCHRDANAYQVGWIGGPDVRLDLGNGAIQIRENLQGLGPTDEQIVALGLPFDAQSAKRLGDHLEVGDAGFANADFAPGYGGCAGEADDLQVIRANRELATVKTRYASDAQRVGSKAFDAGAQRVEAAAQVLHVRLGGGVANNRRRHRL